MTNEGFLIHTAEKMCSEKGHKLLFLTKFGSHLYGTNGPNSDTDVKGLFLPSKKSLILGQRCDPLTSNTGNDKSKNGPEDVDLQLWSLHYFLNLVQIGDTNALDMLYSLSNTECLLFTDPQIFFFMIENHSKLYNLHKLHGYLGHVLGQAKKYGIKGSRLGVIKQVKEWLETNHIGRGARLCNYAPAILEDCQESSYCFSKEVNGEKALVICGKAHLESIPMEEFEGRINRDYERYGERARLSEQNEGVDWKAVSHAFRATHQMAQILTEGLIKFPLETAPFLKKVKSGEVPWVECEKLLLSQMEHLKELQDKTPSVPADTKLIESFILEMYDETV